MTLKYIYSRLQYIRLQIRCKNSQIITKIAEKHLWFRNIYGWYFRQFRFNEKREYGSYVVVKMCDLYNDKTIAEKFAWLIKMCVPEHLHYKIEYLRMENGSIFPDAVGWIYRGTG